MYIFFRKYFCVVTMLMFLYDTFPINRKILLSAQGKDDQSNKYAFIEYLHA